MTLKTALKKAAIKLYLTASDIISEIDDYFVKGPYTGFAEMSEGVIRYRETASGINYRVFNHQGDIVISGNERFSTSDESLESLVARMKVEANQSLRERSL